EICTLAGQVIPLPPLRAVFANYLLDQLPAAVLRAGVGGIEQLCVRTHLTRDRALVSQYTRFSLEEIRALAASADPAERAKLFPRWPLLGFGAAFPPVGEQAPPYAAEALAFGQGLRRVVLNYGAMDCIGECLRLLHRDGFVLIYDYGPVERDQCDKQGT